MSKKTISVFGSALPVEEEAELIILKDNPEYQSNDFLKLQQFPPSYKFH